MYFSREFSHISIILIFSDISHMTSVVFMIVIGIASVDTVHPAITDEFKLGDCVWVSGVKKGTIAFIGETQFAPGVWAGILLDEPIGKNDGSVNGVRYFACQPLCGIFAKLSTLTSHPVDSSSVPHKVPVAADVSKSLDTASDVAGSSDSQPLQDGQSDGSQANNEGTTRAGAGTGRASKLPATSSRPSGLARLSRSTGTASSSNSSLSQTAATTNQSQSEAAAAADVSTGNKTAGSPHALKVGERVVIGGNKAGTLRYFGTTHFAKGEWAGIELDEPVGKNDGSVEGKR